MADHKRSVLITGCSDGSVGAALAVAFHNAGLHVYATARNASKMKRLESLGIETRTLDVLSDSSIAACVESIPSLDILINNAGSLYAMPVTDIDISEARKSFDLNVWAHISVTKAFVPLLLKAPNGMIVNHTSGASVIPIPFQAVYNASKAALAVLSDNLRLEIEPFGIKVVDMKSGMVKSNLIRNGQDSWVPKLPENSIWEPAREIVEKALAKVGIEDIGMPQEQWAQRVVQDLLRKNPPPIIWKGEGATMVWLISLLPVGFFDGSIRKLNSLNVAREIIQVSR
ncbi:hypothetical protein M426DRAFT_320353 [Hypoxylon sp. CI-4A]|nr:hypothetical protein M426DRAFT_320353 [Hypoxylon sp. CI-4A]